MNTNFKGVYAVALTPFHKDGSFDFEAARNHLDWLISKGVHGICVLGATGEYLSVTNEEHKAYVKEIVPYICNRTSVTVGVSRERPDDVIDLIDNAKKCGAHAAMVLSPYYCHPTQEEIFAHYQYINDSIDFPLIIYNNPGSAGVEIEMPTFEKIFKLKNAAIIKESTGDVRTLTQVLLKAPDSSSVFCGCDNLAYESIIMGAHGWVSMLANVAPEDCAALFNLIYDKHEYEKAFEIYKRLLPALNMLETFGKPVQALKYAATLKGLPMGYVRRPRLELTDDEKAYVKATMNLDNIR
jgi:4-hydroxy-tetrahydrodipicolinate synthase